MDNNPLRYSSFQRVIYSQTGNNKFFCDIRKKRKAVLSVVNPVNGYKHNYKRFIETWKLYYSIIPKSLTFHYFKVISSSVWTNVCLIWKDVLHLTLYADVCFRWTRHWSRTCCCPSKAVLVWDCILWPVVEILVPGTGGHPVQNCPRQQRCCPALG